MASNAEITGLLNQWSHGDADAGNLLAPLVYDELHRIAQRLFRSERKARTLQPTALVHECYVKLIGVDVSWQDRAHFFSLAARMMRRLLVNHANARGAAKRGGGAIRVTLDESRAPEDDAGTDLLALDEALTKLAEIDKRKADLIQLQYFGGLTFREMEEVTGLSSSTLDRELRFARAWMKSQLT
ncbi:MAG: ECF-type sigma factor [Gammaproteobacteria bacterium]|nr:ECF-type sigma factor [Gammaproteobacteria bacterium]MDH4256564.1 ECF-type sigma factor [Gammaproteobacteria bacterium]MDH5311375.1 ECF-type sigma factor [Gammaproteobacteria bacterium]